MATVDWTGLGLSSGTVLDAGNINTAGNGTGTLTFQALTGAATRTTIQEANGNGVEINAPAGTLARLDTVAVAGGAECMAVRFVYKCPASAPTTGANYLALGRNANGTPASSGNVQHTTSGTIEFRTAADAVASTSGGSPFGISPTLVGGDYYLIDMGLVLNTLTTPTTSNGRIIGRVQSLSAPGSWNSGSDYFFDSGYTSNVTTDKTNLFRTGHVITTGGVGTFRLLNLKWRDLTTPDTDLAKGSALSNLVPTLVYPVTRRYPARGLILRGRR